LDILTDINTARAWKHCL